MRLSLFDQDGSISLSRMLGRDGKHTYHAIEFNLATLLGEVSGRGSGGSELDVLLIPALLCGLSFDAVRQPALVSRA